MRTLPPLTLPETLHPDHAALLRGHRFESAGTVAHVLSDDEYDGIRALYAITNPACTAVVYIGESEAGRDIRGRIKAHMNARDKAGNIEKDSLVFVHVMVTEFMVMDAFEQLTGQLPLLNHHKTMKHTAHPGRKVNDLAAMRATQQAAKDARTGATPPKPRKGG